MCDRTYILTYIRLRYLVQLSLRRGLAVGVRSRELRKRKKEGVRKPAEEEEGKSEEAEGTNKIGVAPGVTIASLRWFRAALIRPTQGLPKQRRLRR